MASSSHAAVDHPHLELSGRLEGLEFLHHGAVLGDPCFGFFLLSCQLDERRRHFLDVRGELSFFGDDAREVFLAGRQLLAVLGAHFEAGFEVAALFISIFDRLAGLLQDTLELGVLLFGDAAAAEDDHCSKEGNQTTAGNHERLREMHEWRAGNRPVRGRSMPGWAVGQVGVSRADPTGMPKRALPMSPVPPRQGRLQ